MRSVDLLLPINDIQPYIYESTRQSAPLQSSIKLAEVSNVERTDLKPYCLVVETSDRRVFISLKNDDEVYGWQEDIYSRSPLMGVSHPTNFVHKVHVGFDPVTGAFTVWFRPVSHDVALTGAI